ncbi:MAG: hypothetical protein ACE5I2_10265, partial [Anaerolineae bacterium]
MKIFDPPVGKRFLMIFLPLLALAAGIVTVLYYRDARTERIILEAKEVHSVDLQSKTILSDFMSAVSDLMYLSEHIELQEM